MYIVSVLVCLLVLSYVAMVVQQYRRQCQWCCCLATCSSSRRRTRTKLWCLMTQVTRHHPCRLLIVITCDLVHQMN